MSNLFIGFPVPRAKIADMITGAAPPLNHVINHKPAGSDPIVLPGDISDDEVLQWNGTKFIGTAAPADGGFPSPLSIHGCNFLPVDDQVDYDCHLQGLRKRSTTTSGLFYCPVFLPHGVTVTKLTIWAYCQASGSTCNVNFYRINNVGAFGSLAICNNNWWDGDGTRYDDSINNPVIDNVNYSYACYVFIDPTTLVGNAILRRIMIDFT